MLGVVSRGAGCAEFNSPAVYGSVSKAFEWIKKTITKEMGKDQACPVDKGKQKSKKGSDYRDNDFGREEFKHYLVETNK